MSRRLNLSKLASKDILAWVLLVLGLLIVPFYRHFLVAPDHSFGDGSIC